MVNETLDIGRESSSSLERVMGPLILLYRFGDKDYHPEMNSPEENRCKFGRFKNDIVDALWNCKEKITPKEYFNIVRKSSKKEAEGYKGAIDKKYFAHILEQTVLGHLHQLDLGKWGRDLLGIYSQNLCNSELVFG